MPSNRIASFVVVMTFNTEHKDADHIVVNIINDNVFARDMPRVGYVFATDKRLGMTQTGAWMVHYLDVFRVPKPFFCVLFHSQSFFCPAPSVLRFVIDGCCSSVNSCKGIEKWRYHVYDFWHTLFTFYGFTAYQPAYQPFPTATEPVSF